MTRLEHVEYIYSFDVHSVLHIGMTITIDDQSTVNGPWSMILSSRQQQMITMTSMFYRSKE